jgi:hypothetical protein
MSSKSPIACLAILRHLPGVVVFGIFMQKLCAQVIIKAVYVSIFAAPRRAALA